MSTYSLYSLHISPLSDVELVKIFSNSVSCLLDGAIVSFALHKPFCFMRYHLLVFFFLSLTSWPKGVLLRKSSVPMSSMLFTTFSSITPVSLVLCLGLWFSCGFLFGVQDAKWIYLHSCDQHHLPKLSFLQCVFLTSLSKRRCP